MGTMPVGKLLFTMAWPMMLSMLFQALYNIVDSYFVAKLSQDALNAVSLAFPLQNLCIAFAGGTGVGMNALLSRSLGEKNQKAADRAANTGIFLFLCSAALFALLSLTLAGPFFRFQTKNAQIIAYGTDYVRICLGLSLGIFMQMCMERLLQSTGRTSLAMISQITGAAINMILDPIMIFGLFGFPRLEVAGAAVATLCGQFIGAALGIFLNIRKNAEIHLRLRDIRPHKRTAAEIYAIGIPSIIMQSIGSVMTFGMNALLSRSLGEKNQKAADRAANTGIFLFLCNAALFALIGLTLAGPFFRFQTKNAQIIAYGTDYVRICLGLSLGLFMQMCMERLLQSTGRTNLAMIAQITGAAINMILDPIMIFGLFGFPRLEVAGAAVATLCGQFIGAAIGVFLNIRKNAEIHLRLRDIRPHKRTAAEIYAIGIPSIIMQSIGSVMTFGMNKILISFTEAATAVFGAYFKLQSFIFMPVFGLNNAMVPIVAYNYGAAKPERLKKAVRLTIATAVCIMSIGCGLFELIPSQLLGLFAPSEEMLSIGTTALRIIGIHFPFAGFCIIAGSVCQALGKPVYALINSVCRQIIVLLPAAFLLSLTGRLELVWFAFPIAEVSSVILNSVFLRRTYRARLGSAKPQQ